MTVENAISERFERLEALIDQQQETIAAQQATIEHQQDRLDELAAAGTPAGTSPNGGSLPIGRRGALQAGGALALLGLGVGSATAQPQAQGSVGTETRPLETVHTVGLEATEIDAEAVVATKVQGETVEAATVLGENVEVTASLKSAELETEAVEAATILGETVEATEILEATEIDAGAIESTTILGGSVEASGAVKASSIETATVEATGKIDTAEITAETGGTTAVEGRSSSSDGRAVHGVNTSGSGYGVYSDGNSKTEGDHETTGDAEIGGDTTISGDAEIGGDTEISGDAEIGGDTEISGKLSFPDGSPQRTGGPIAKAWIESTEEGEYDTPVDEIVNGVNVENVSWHSGQAGVSSTGYTITISGIDYSSDEYVTVVAPYHTIDDPPAIPSVFATQGGDLRIRFVDHDGDVVATSFQFVTYALPDGVESTGGG